MMQVIAPRSWKEEFTIAAAVKRADILHREKSARHEELERQRRKDEQLADQEQSAEAMVVETVLATPESIAEFRVELDEYDAKTVEALMENNEALEAVRERIDAMLLEAHVLPDGRRVFKTKDGQHVFDEHGQELPPETIDPKEIDDTKPRWEEFKAFTDEDARLTAEREQLLDYQAKLDEARERLDSGEITQAEIDQLKKDLAADMPDAVREKLNLNEPKADAAPVQEAKTIEAANAEPAMPSNMDSLMRQTGFSPAGP